MQPPELGAEADGKPDDAADVAAGDGERLEGYKLRSDHGAGVGG